MPDDSAEPKRARRGRRSGAFAPEPTLNTLEATPARTRAQRASQTPIAARGPEPADPRDDPERRAAPPESPAPAQGRPTFATVPDRLLERYYRIGAKYYLDNGELAFTHRENQLTTASENREIVRDLVGIAHHNGVRDITVSGTERFRREAWAAATRLGIEVRGYEPTVHDEKQWVRAMAQEKAARGRPAQATAEPDAGSTPPAAVAAVEESEHASTASARGAGSHSTRRDRTYTGELLAHGSENYHRSPHEDMSYYVQLDLGGRTVELWGLDLQRALRESKSHPQIGDRIIVRRTGQHDVTVRAKEFDSSGQLLGEKDKATHRNAWRIEKADFVAEREALARVVRDVGVSPERGTQAHPQLSGTYSILSEAEIFAAERFQTKEERQRFIEYTRARLAEAIERGDPLPTHSPRDQRAERAHARQPREAPAREAAGPPLG